MPRKKKEGGQKWKRKEKAITLKTVVKVEKTEDTTTKVTERRLSSRLKLKQAKVSNTKSNVPQTTLKGRVSRKRSTTVHGRISPDVILCTSPKFEASPEIELSALPGPSQPSIEIERLELGTGTETAVSPSTCQKVSIKSNEDLWITSTLLADKEQPGFVDFLNKFLCIPADDFKKLQKHPSATALKNCIMKLHCAEYDIGEVYGKLALIAQQCYHMKGALQKEYKAVALLNEDLKKKSDEVEVLQERLKREKERFTMDWRKRDTERVVQVATANALEQKFFLNKKFEDAVQLEKEKYDKLTKEIEKDRMSLAKENERLHKQVTNLTAQREIDKSTIADLMRKIKANEKKLTGKVKSTDSKTLVEHHVNIVGDQLFQYKTESFKNMATQDLYLSVLETVDENVEDTDNLTSFENMGTQDLDLSNHETVDENVEDTDNLTSFKNNETVDENVEDTDNLTSFENMGTQDLDLSNHETVDENVEDTDNLTSFKNIATQELDLPVHETVDENVEDTDNLTSFENMGTQDLDLSIHEIVDENVEDTDNLTSFENTGTQELDLSVHETVDENFKDTDNLTSFENMATQDLDLDLSVHETVDKNVEDTDNLTSIITKAGFDFLKDDLSISSDDEDSGPADSEGDLSDSPDDTDDKFDFTATEAESDYGQNTDKCDVDKIKYIALQEGLIPPPVPSPKAPADDLQRKETTGEIKDPSLQTIAEERDLLTVSNLYDNFSIPDVGDFAPQAILKQDDADKSILDVNKKTQVRNANVGKASGSSPSQVRPKTVVQLVQQQRGRKAQSAATTLRGRLASQVNDIVPVSEGKMCQKKELEQMTNNRKERMKQLLSKDPRGGEPCKRTLRNTVRSNSNARDVSSYPPFSDSDIEVIQTVPGQLRKETAGKPILPDADAGQYQSFSKARISHLSQRPPSHLPIKAELSKSSPEQLNPLKKSGTDRMKRKIKEENALPISLNKRCKSANKVQSKTTKNSSPLEPSHDSAVPDAIRRKPWLDRCNQKSDLAHQPGNNNNGHLQIGQGQMYHTVPQIPGYNNTYPYQYPAPPMHYLNVPQDIESPNKYLNGEGKETEVAIPQMPGISPHPQHYYPYGPHPHPFYPFGYPYGVHNERSASPSGGSNGSDSNETKQVMPPQMPWYGYYHHLPYGNGPMYGGPPSQQFGTPVPPFAGPPPPFGCHVPPYRASAAPALSSGAPSGVPALPSGAPSRAPTLPSGASETESTFALSHESLGSTLSSNKSNQFKLASAAQQKAEKKTTLNQHSHKLFTPEKKSFRRPVCLSKLLSNTRSSSTTSSVQKDLTLSDDESDEADNKDHENEVMDSRGKVEIGKLNSIEDSKDELEELANTQILPSGRSNELLDNSIVAHQYQLTQSTPLSPPMMPVPELGREKKLGVIYQNCEWDGMIYASKGQLCKMAKDFLEDVLRRSEHDIKHNFEGTSQQCGLTDMALAAEIYQYLFEDAAENNQQTGDILSIIQRKLLQVIRNLQSQKSSVYGTLPQLVFEYFWSQIIPNVAKNQFQNDAKTLEKLGRFYGTLCNEFSIKDGVKQLIFETLYWRPPNAFAMAHGLLRVCSEVYSYLSFDDYSLRDRAILFSLLKPTRFNDAVACRMVRTLLLTTCKIQVPDITFQQFVKMVVQEVKKFEAEAMLQDSSKVLAMLFLNLGSLEDSIGFISGELTLITKEWRNDQLSDGVFAAYLRAFGETFEASVEKAEPKKLEGIQAALKCLLESCNASDFSDFSKQAIDNTIQKIKQKILRSQNIHKPWKWAYAYFKSTVQKGKNPGSFTTRSGQKLSEQQKRIIKGSGKRNFKRKIDKKNSNSNSVSRSGQLRGGMRPVEPQSYTSKTSSQWKLSNNLLP